MGFLNGGLAWLALGGVVPILIHILNRQRYRRVRWAAMEFLLAALRRTRRRVQLENLLLLLVRVLAVVLLAFMIARPYFTSAPLGVLEQKDTLHLLVLDHSYSMAQRAGAETLFDRARLFALEALEELQLTRGDEFAILLMCDHPEALYPEPSRMRDEARRKLKELAFGYHGPGLEETIQHARRLLENSSRSRKRLYLVTDMQRCTWLAPEARRESILADLLALQTRAECYLVDVGVNVTDNAAVTDLVSRAGVLGSGLCGTFCATVRNFGESALQEAQLRFSVDSQLAATQSLPDIRPGESYEASLRHAFLQPGPHSVQVDLVSRDPLQSPDTLEVDNVRYLAADVKDRLRALIYDGDFHSGDERYRDEVYAFRRALATPSSGSERVSLFEAQVVVDSTFQRAVLDDFDVVILANVSSLIPERVADLERYVRHGGGLWIFLGDRVNRDLYNVQLYRDGEGLLPARLLDVEGDPTRQQEVRLRELDFDHPALSRFRSGREALNIFFIFRYVGVEVDPEARDVRVLACYSDAERSPALLEKFFGRAGKVLLCTTSCDPDWNLMCKVGTYPAFVDQLALYLCSRGEYFKNFLVSQTLVARITGSRFSRDYFLRTPGGDDLPVALAPLREARPPPAPEDSASSVPREVLYRLAYRKADTPGLYRLMHPAADPSEKPAAVTFFGVNVDPQESDLTRLEPAELTAMFPGFEPIVLARLSEADSRSVLRGHTGNFWLYLAWIVLGLLLLETVMAQVFGKRQ